MRAEARAAGRILAQEKPSPAKSALHRATGKRSIHGEAGPTLTRSSHNAAGPVRSTSKE